MEQQKRLPGKEGEVAERSGVERSGAGSSLRGAVRLDRSEGSFAIKSVPSSFEVN